MKVFVDGNACLGYGLCVGNAPEVFTLRDDKALVLAEAVPSEHEDAVETAVDDCPAQAIRIETD